MKKLIFILLSFICLSSLGQINYKLGNLEIPDSITELYLLDCYKNPDTISAKNIRSGFMLSEEYNSIESFNENLKKRAIREITKRIYYKSYIDTLWKASYYYCNGMNGPRHSKEYDSIVIVPAGSYIENMELYLVPRTPSMDDFRKFIHRQNKK